MKKLRKMTAALVGMAMALSMVPQMAMAERTDDRYLYGWYVSGPEQGDHIKAYVDENDAVSGTNSLYIQKDDGNWADFSVDQNVTIPAGTYTLSLWVKGGYEDATTVLLEDGHWQTHKLLNGEYTTGTEFTRTEGENGWTKLEKTLTVDTTTRKFRIITVGWAGGFYVDDISLVKEGTTNNIITNGSFEVKTPEYTTELTDYFVNWNDWSAIEKDGSLVFMCVTDEVSHSGNNSFVLRHVDNSKTSNICIAQNVPSLEAGNYTISFWSIGVKNNGLQAVTLADPWKRYPLENFTVTDTDGEWSKYELTVTADGGETAISFPTDGQTEGWYIDDISLVKEGTTENLIKNGSFDIDGVPSYTTEFADYFYSWSDWSAVERDGNLVFLCVTDEMVHSGDHSFVLRHIDNSKPSNICIAQNVPSLEAGNYTISFWSAGVKNNGLQAMTLADPWRRYPMEQFTVTETDGAWSKYELAVTATGGETAITFATDGQTEGWYIDDISLVKEGTTKNIIANGSFDDDGIPDYKTEFEDYFYGWEREYNIAENGSTIFTCVTDELSHSGNYSFLLRSLDTGDKDLVLKQTGLGLGEGTYTLSFWATGTVADWDNDSYRYQQIVWLEGLDPSYNYVTNMTTSETDGDWRKYVLEFTVPAGSTVNSVKLSTRGHGTKGMYVDDFTLTASGSDANLLKNGSFEDDGVPDYTTALEKYFYNWEREYNIAENGSTIFTCVTDEKSHSGNNSFVLRSLDTGDKDLMLKQTGLGLGEGSYTLSFWATGTVADWDNDSYRYQQIVWLEGLDPSYNYVTNMTTSETDGEWRKYVLNFTVPSGTTVNSVKLSTRGHGTAGMYVDDFTLTAAGSDANLLKNGSFEDDGIPEYTTAYNEYFAGWNDWSAIEKDGNLVFMCVTDEKSHSGNNSFVLRHVDNSKPSNICIAQNVPSLEAGEYTISFWSTGAKKNGLQAVTLADPWKRYPLESFTVTDTDGEWSKYELTVTADGGETAISFPTDGQTEGWFIDDISLVKAGTTENLVKNGGFEYKGLNGYYVSAPKVMKIEGESKREITALESGLLEISLEVTNYTMGDDFAPVLIAALYNGDKYVKMGYGKQISYERQAEGFVEDELCFTVEVPQMTAGADYSLKIMCWDGLTSLVPLMDALEIE